MNNLYGAIGTTVILVLLFYVYVLINREKSNKPIIVSQSMLQYRYSNRNTKSRKLKTGSQSRMHYDKTNIKVIILDNNAYWIKDNIFYKAPLINELIDKDSAEQVDTIHMDKVQLDKMLFIMDKLREGMSDDSRSAGDQ
jgi:hypothetical protein